MTGDVGDAMNVGEGVRWIALLPRESSRRIFFTHDWALTSNVRKAPQCHTAAGMLFAVVEVRHDDPIYQISYIIRLFPLFKQAGTT